MAGHVRHARDFVDRRRDAIDSGRASPRIYAIESSYSLTGARADRRVALRPADIASFARSIAFKLDAVADGPRKTTPWRRPSQTICGVQALSLFLGGNTHDGHDIVRAHWRDALGSADFEAAWQKMLSDGVVPNSAAPTLDVSLRSDWDRTLTGLPLSGLSVVFAPDPSVWDGRHANNGWLQELPRPTTKIVWDNAALIAPATAVALGLETGDIVTFGAGGRSLCAPVRLTPGHGPDTITLPLGYGRRAAGRIGTGVGFDANALRSSGALLKARQGLSTRAT